MQTILETNRFLLREMSRADLDFVAEMLSHPEMMRYYPKLFTRDEAQEWLERQMTRYEKDGQCAISRRCSKAWHVAGAGNDLS